MTSSSNTPIAGVPDHLHTVTPRLVVSDGPAAIAFYRNAFGAEQLGDAFTAPSGQLIHAELRIGDSVVMVTEDAGDDGAPVKAPSSLGGMVTAIMAMYWPDVDVAWERAVAAGAEIVYPLADQFYGERGGRLRNPFGQQWMLSQRTEDLTPESLDRRAAEFFDSAD